MLSIKTFSLVVLLAILSTMSYPFCKGREIKCDKCVYGCVISKFSEVPECRKGPNERCGGVDNINGVCGDGMLCQRERCVGCSLDTFQCSHENPDKTFRPIH